jgi:hypothetical protein
MLGERRLILTGYGASRPGPQNAAGRMLAGEGILASRKREARSEKRGVRSQESGVRSQESGWRIAVRRNESKRPRRDCRGRLGWTALLFCRRDYLRRTPKPIAARPARARIAVEGSGTALPATAPKLLRTRFKSVRSTVPSNG